MSEYGKLLFKIRVHPTLWFVIGIAILTAHFIEVMMLLLIVFIHEMGHAVCAQHFKWRIKSIQLLPFGGAVETEEYGNKSLKEDLAVVLAGPLQHVWLIGAAFLLYFFTIIPYELYQPFLYMNLMLLIFNLLPIWPLDGGRLLFIGVSLYCTFLEAQKHTLHFSAVFAFLAFFDLAHSGSAQFEHLAHHLFHKSFTRHGMAAEVLCVHPLSFAAPLRAYE